MVVPRCRRFDVRAPRTRRITGAGSSGYEWARNVPREKRLAFTVTPSMPGLAVRTADTLLPATPLTLFCQPSFVLCIGIL
jgi:hypothetical protein